MCWYLVQSWRQGRQGVGIKEHWKPHGYTYASTSESPAKSRFASEQHSPACLGVGWQGGVGKGVAGFHTFPIRDTHC